MNTKRVLQHSVIVLYCVVTFSAFVYTFTRIELPIVPRPLMRFSYGMMAPFQGYLTENWELVAHGKKSDDQWERIDLHTYIPFARGEFNMRGALLRFMIQGEEIHRQQYINFATQLLEREQNYKAIKLAIERWPVSTVSYEELRIPAFTTEELLVVIP